MKYLIAVTLALAACAGPQSDSSNRAADLQDPQVIAVFDGGQVTRQQVDEAILALPAAERNNYGVADLELYRELLRQLATDRLLRARAESSGFTRSVEYTTALGEMYRQVLVQQCLIDSPQSLEAPTDKEIRQRYDESREQHAGIERRFVLSIFRRRQPGQDPAPKKAELESLRQRVLAGENFTVLARKHSESESRHMSGAVGWVHRGQLSPDLDRILFSLEEGVPSEPIVTAEGVHLFYIETELKDLTPPLEAVAEPIRQTMLRERRSIALQELIDNTELPAEAFVPTRKELENLLREGEPTSMLLRIGEFELDREELRRKATQESLRSASEQQSLSQRALAIFNGIKQREVLYLRFKSEGKTLRPEIQSRFDHQAQAFLAQRFGESLMQRQLDLREQELAEFYDLHKKRFVTLLELRLKALVAPFGDTPGKNMAILEQQRENLESGELTLEELAAQVGGEIQESDWVDINSLTAFRAKAAFFAPAIATGGYSPPYNNGRAIEIFQVLERREPRPLGLEAARQQVRDAYLERHGQKLYDDLVTKLLEETRFEIIEPRLIDLASGVSSGSSVARGAEQ